MPNKHALGDTVIVQTDRDTKDIGKIVGITEEFDQEGQCRRLFSVRFNGTMPMQIPADVILCETADILRHLVAVGEGIRSEPYREASGLKFLIRVLASPDAARSIAADASEIPGALRVLFAELLRSLYLLAGHEVNAQEILNDPDHAKPADDDPIPF